MARNITEQHDSRTRHSARLASFLGSMKWERTETAMSMRFTASDPARAVHVVERLAHVAAAASGCLTGLAGAGLGGGGGVRVVGEVDLGEGLGGGRDRVRSSQSGLLSG